MIAEWPAVASRDHEVHEVCLAAEHAESQSLPPKIAELDAEGANRMFLPTEYRSFPTAKQNFKSQPQEKGAP